LDVIGRCGEAVDLDTFCGGEAAVAFLLGSPGALDRPPLARLASWSCSQWPLSAAQAFRGRAWPPVCARLRPCTVGTALESLERRVLQRRYPNAELASLVPVTGFCFAAQGPLEVASAVSAATLDGGSTVTGVDPLGCASLITIEPGDPR
jgi:hypothetical protein